MLKNLKKIGVLSITLLSSLIMYAKQFTVYYRDTANKNRGIWLFNAGSKDETFHKSNEKDGKYQKFILEVDDSVINPGIVFAPLINKDQDVSVIKSDNSEQYINWKDKDFRGGTYKDETLDSETLYFFADKDIKLSEKIEDTIDNTQNISDEQKNKLKLEIDKKNTQSEVNSFKNEIENLSTLMINSLEKVKELKSSIDNINNREIKVVFYNKANEFEKLIKDTIDENVIGIYVEKTIAYKQMVDNAKKYVDEIFSNKELSNDKKNEYYNKIKDAKDNASLELIYNDFRAESDKISAKKEEALTELDKLTNLAKNKEKFEEYKKKINEATDINVIDQILEEAKKSNMDKIIAPPAVDPLQKQKDDAIKIITDLKYLSQDDKDKAKHKITNSSDEGTINEILEAAKKDDVKAKKDELEEEIDLAKISKAQSDKLKANLVAAKTIEEVLKVQESFDNLKNTNDILNEKIAEYTKTAEKLDEKTKKEVSKLLADAKIAADKATKADAISELIEKLEADLSKLLVNLDDAKYKEVADAFFYTNHDLFNKLRDNIYFDVKFNQHILKDHDSLGGITLGGNYEFKDLNLKVGGFVEYDNNKAHNVSLGGTVFYNDFSAFARYRLAILKKETNLLNHNFDVLAKYSHKYNFDKVNVEPMGSIYMTISSKVKIDENVSLKPRFGFDVNFGTKVSYDVLDNLRLYTTPSFTVSYNDQKLENVITKEEKTINRSYFNYGIDFGADYTINNFVIRPNINLNGDMQKNLNFKAKLGVGYNF